MGSRGTGIKAQLTMAACRYGGLLLFLPSFPFFFSLPQPKYRIIPLARRSQRRSKRDLLSLGYSYTSSCRLKKRHPKTSTSISTYTHARIFPQASLVTTFEAVIDGHALRDTSRMSERGEERQSGDYPETETRRDDERG